MKNLSKPTSVIAIDGPAAAGKSTIGNRIAQQLDYLFFDTGIMYRAVTWAALTHGVDVDQQERVGQLVGEILIDIQPPKPTETDGRQCTVLVDGQDVTWEIRTAQVDQNVSAVAANPAVRHALTDQQRRIGLRFYRGAPDENADEKAGIIMVGRDIGTVVMPEAPLKVYMDASAEERAQRRFDELVERGKQVHFDQILADIKRRDKIDSERDIAPLRAADDAVVIDTSNLLPEQVIEEILQHVC